MPTGAYRTPLGPPAPPLEPALEYRRVMAMARSAGVLLFRITASDRVEALLCHMGGPFHERRDDGTWSIPKGEYDADKDPRAPGVSRRCGIGFALAQRLLLNEGARVFAHSYAAYDTTEPWGADRGDRRGAHWAGRRE